MKLLMNMLLFCILVSIGCIPKEQNIDIVQKQLVSDYISFIKNDVSKNDSLIIVVRQVNEYVNAFRISAWLDHLPPNFIPDSIDSIDNCLVVSFDLKRADSITLNRIKNKLLKIGVTSNVAFGINSNYPEWVLLVGRTEGNHRLIKDAWYRPMEELLNNK